MVKVIWGYDDPEPVPGPPDRAYRLPWDDPWCEPISAAHEWADLVLYGFTKRTRELSVSIHTWGRALDANTEQHTDPETPNPGRNQRKNIGSGRVRNHGPRAQQTFDRRGNRRY